MLRFLGLKRLKPETKGMAPGLLSWASPMNVIVTLLIGITASRAAHAAFPGSRWVRTLTLGLGGALAGGFINVIELGAEHLVGFAPMNIFWSTLGAVVALAIGVVLSRQHLANRLP